MTTGTENYTNAVITSMQNEVKKCTSTNISLSGGIDSSILLYLLKDKIINAITITLEDFKSLDLKYAQYITNKFGIKLNILKISNNEIISAIDNTIKILKNFNDIEIRNSVIMYLVLKYIKNTKYKNIITGDGADELFFGYNYMLKKNMNELHNEFQRILNIMHFPVLKLGNALNIKIETPFLHNAIIKLAEHIPINLKINLHNNIKYGKWILRKSFEKYLPNLIIWREKLPIQNGTGSANLTDFFHNLINDQIFKERSNNIYYKDNVIIRSKESLYYYEIFRKYYDAPYKLNDSTSHVCTNCKYKKKTNSKFCSMCGSFPI
ncbi:MAG: asparagine synthase-related protein [Thaumarchaeota archaeon]|nr:asparagine synthase-related protein [Nitrososphaerota archaeon]